MDTQTARGQHKPFAKNLDGDKGLETARRFSTSANNNWRGGGIARWADRNA